MIEGRPALHDLLQAKHDRLPKPDANDVQDERFFGHMRGMQDTGRVIEIRRGAGSWPALRYCYLKYSEWLHAGEFRLHYITGETVIVRGRNLRTMYDYLLMEKLAYIREATPDEAAPEHELFVDAVTYSASEDKELSDKMLATP